MFPYKIIDLTHALDENVPTWEGGCGFHVKERCGAFCVQKIEMNGGIGTHLDAPAHRFPGKETVDQLGVWVAPGVVIDVSSVAHEGYLVSVEDVWGFERQWGVIEPGCLVMIRTGWDRFWHEHERYRRFPSVSKEAAELLLERQMVGIGVDTLSPDGPESSFPVHEVVLGNGKIIVENVANLSSLPAKGSYILTLPMKIKGGFESPVRLVGLL